MIETKVPDRTGTACPAERRRGRGAVSNVSGRFEREQREAVDDGWAHEDDELAPLRTTVTFERPRRIITRNRSPDVPFDRSINPYRGCEHGCIYCYARPSHSYHGLSAGLDFETRLFAKPGAARLLERELNARGYAPHPIAIGTNTDPYQPIERRWQITRQVLEVLARARHPVSLVTKSVLVLRDLDILEDLAANGLVRVFISLTTLDHRLARTMEPRASAPHRRLHAIARLAEAGVPTGVMVAPVIPAINDHEIEAILTAAHAAGATSAGYVPIRLPHEVKDLFGEWLAEHFPERKARVLALIRDLRGGRLNDPQFGRRMRGQGPLAALLSRRFRLVCRRLGFDQRYDLPSAPDRPIKPGAEHQQLTLL